MNRILLIAAIGTEFVLQSVVALFQNGILFFVVVASVLHSVSSYASDDKIRVKIIREEDHDFCRGQQRTTLQQASDLKTAALMEGLIANPSSNKPIETFNIDQIKTTLGSKEMNNSQIYGLAERVLESYSLFSMAFDLINRSDLKNTYVRENIGTQIVVGYLLLDHKMKKKLNPYFTTEEIRGKLLEFQKGNYDSNTDPFLQKIKKIVLPELKIEIDLTYPILENEVSEIKKMAMRSTIPGQDEHFFKYQIFFRDKAMRKEIYKILDTTDYKNFTIHIGSMHLPTLQTELLSRYDDDNIEVTTEICKIKFDFSDGLRKGTKTRDY